MTKHVAFVLYRYDKLGKTAEAGGWPL